MNSTFRVRIAGVASYLPPTSRSSSDVEDMIAASSPDVTFPRGIVELMTGVRSRRVADEGVNASDLAGGAGRRVLEATRTHPNDVDFLIFASASQDLLEPATANIVQEKVGTACPVIDVKNACNSFLSGLQVGEALILSGSVKKVLVTTGEIPSRSIKWAVDSREDLKASFPGYTLGDAGAAALLMPSDDERGIFHRSFQTVSRHWPLATILGGGSIHPRGDEYSYFQSEGTALRDAFAETGPGILEAALKSTQTTLADYARILVHQVSLPSLRSFLAVTGVPADRVELTLPDLGNIASATLPIGFVEAERAGHLSSGDRVLWIGLASGISIGVLALQL